MGPPPTLADWLQAALALALLGGATALGMRLPAPRFRLGHSGLLAAAAALVAAYGLGHCAHPHYFEYHRFFVHLGAALCAWLVALARADAEPGALKIALAAATALALASHLSFGRLRGDGALHHHELAHYYMGSKYFAEVGYDGLYRAYVAADLEGRRELKRTDPVRDLTTRAIVPVGADVPAIAAVRERFSNSRWAEFQQDAAHLQAALGPEKWKRLLVDHGYNPSPVWTLVGWLAGGLAAAAGGGDFGRTLGFAALYDPVLIALTLALIAWAYGLELAGFAALYLWANPFVPFDFTGGAFLRQDWVFCTVAAVCCARRGHGGTGGALLAYAAATRVFPGLLAVLPALQQAREWWREGRWDPQRDRFLGAFALSLAGLVLASMLTVAGPSTWLEFLALGRKHDEGAYLNHVSARTLASFEPRRTQAAMGDWRPWERHKLQRFANIRIVFWPLVALATGALLARFRNARLDGALAVGGFLPFLWLSPAAYYANYLWPLAFAGPGAPRLALAVALAGTAGTLFIDDFEVYNVYLSGAVLVWLAAVLIPGGLTRRPDPPTVSGDGEAP